ncbi:hypothetical protein PBI_POLKA_65 [Arthrobacter phage Polka]|uniref:Uncharacterized protein n=1 Tax=Arthrobacter phage Polka TaxID=2419966 RepID=A0A3G2KIV1_9CAUD|nr:hypothetical protein PBI_POLKA_65 [Arthrobacter phage Polka]
MKRSGPEQWHAVVLRDEIERLTVAVRALEFADGYSNGYSDGRAVARPEQPEGWRVQLGLVR